MLRAIIAFLFLSVCLQAAELRVNDKGYLEKNDALPNSWLESNFESCDKDRDGKITESEYTKCMKNKP